MNPGDVILARLQQSDTRIKTRPAIVLTALPPFDDLLISGVSSKLRHEVLGFDEALRGTDSDFGRSGLKVDSLIRLGMITTIPARAVAGKLGSISHERIVRLRNNLAGRIKADSGSGSGE